MSWYSKVVWSEGLFLRPQHFQQHERYLESYVRERTGGQNPYDYGFKSLQLDSELLGLGKIAVVSAEGIMPDGTPFRIPEDTDAPEPMEVGQRGAGFGVALALPARRPHATDVEVVDGTDGALRYVVKRAAVQDSTARDGSEAEIELARLRFRLMRDDEELGGYVHMGMTRVAEVRTDGSILLENAYLPPILNCHNFQMLRSGIIDLNGRLRQRGEELAGALGELARSGAADFWEFLLLQIVNRYEPLVEHYARLPVVHPETLYRLFIQVVGDVAMLTRESKRPATLPEYRHDALYETFEPVVMELRRAFSRTVEPSAVWIDLEDRGNFLYRGIPTDRELLEEATFILAVKADMPPQEIRERIVQRAEMKILSEQKLNDIGGLSGLKLEDLTTKPREIPHHPGFLYFQLDRTGHQLQLEMWKQIKRSGAFWINDSGPFPGLQMEFWAIKQ